MIKFLCAVRRFGSPVCRTATARLLCLAFCLFLGDAALSAPRSSKAIDSQFPARSSRDSASMRLSSAKNIARYVEVLAREPVSPRNASSIALAYEHCGIFFGPADFASFKVNYLRTLKINDPANERRVALMSAEYQRCADLLAHQFDVYRARRYWLQRGANGGDLIAKLTLRLEATPTAENIQSFEQDIQLALNSRDPDVLWEVSKSLGHAGFTWITLAGKEFPVGAKGKPVDGLRAVFQSAACNIGYACGADSNMIRNFCIRGTCSADTYAQWLPSFLSAEQLGEVNAQLPRVERALRIGQGSGLIFKP